MPTNQQQEVKQSVEENGDMVWLEYKECSCFKAVFIGNRL